MLSQTRFFPYHFLLRCFKVDNDIEELIVRANLTSKFKWNLLNVFRDKVYTNLRQSSLTQ